ncbi:MAG: carbohydrate-binding domain-containing protein [Peptostreptococcaceae bacterium]|nr:carbohydrate-binding domain-containing protein [Peptostreptococcaceae bacterium]
MNKKFLAMMSALSLCVTVTACSKTDTQKSENTTSKTSINIESLESETVGQADTYIKLGSNTTIEGDGATFSNNKITITKAGTYSINGTLEDGQVIVDAGDEDKVYIILDGVNIRCSNNAPIYVKNAKKTILALADGSENNITDGETYELEDNSSNEPNAAIYSKDDIAIIGNGKLTVNANYNNGIVSNDDLKIQSGNIVVKAKNNGIKGKDRLNITDGNITITSDGDGLKADNTSDATKGYVYIEGGKINITSGEDGIQAKTDLLIADGDITIKTGGGSANSSKSNKVPGQKPDNMMQGERPEIPSGDFKGGERPQMPSGSFQGGERPQMPSGEFPGGEMPKLPENMQPPTQDNTETTTDSSTDESTSMKALKATNNIIIDGGKFNIDSEDDAIHSNSNAIINNGTFEIASGDDGIHSDTQLDINGGNINITTSYEGLESTTLSINDGNISIVASDDGLNAAGGNDRFSSSSDGLINITGGYIYINASGDGIDANGNIKMSDGTVLVDGPTNAGNGSLDYDGTFDITGGTLVAAGSSGMAQYPSESSSQKVLNISLVSQEANTLVNVKTSNGDEVLTYAPSKNYSSVIISTPYIKDNTKYTVSVGGSSTGDVKNGLYSNGKYSGGTTIGSATTSSIITSITQEGASANGMMMPGGIKGPGGMKGGRGQRNENSGNSIKFKGNKQMNNQLDTQLTIQ